MKVPMGTVPILERVTRARDTSCVQRNVEAAAPEMTRHTEITKNPSPPEAGRGCLFHVEQLSVPSAARGPRLVPRSRRESESEPCPTASPGPRRLWHRYARGSRVTVDLFLAGAPFNVSIRPRSWTGRGRIGGACDGRDSTRGDHVAAAGFLEHAGCSARRRTTVTFSRLFVSTISARYTVRRRRGSTREIFRSGRAIASGFGAVPHRTDVDDACPRG